jgi:acetyl-CoA carboxylase biotin carboxylase subunit
LEFENPEGAKMPMFKKILIANRGEIAVRVIRACREMGIKAVAVYSDADRDALHVRLADEAYYVGPAPSRESYLVIDNIIEAGKRSGADAVHPGYGFLSENSKFPQACRDAGMVFIGPDAESMLKMGDKTLARQTVIPHGVPVVPGTTETFDDLETATKVAREIGFPVMCKAAAGGGGKGLRLVESEAEFKDAYAAARREAMSAFGDDRVYIEKFVRNPRHVEIQVVGDHHGNYIHLFERECSLQRRHQKVIEESPSPFISQTTREKMAAAAIAAAKSVNYVNAGTIEFLVDPDQNFYFLEMNTRLQVEHPVTEMVTGVDLVKLQIMVANGEPIPYKQHELTQNGHAIEARIYAEDPFQNWMPSPGKIHKLRVPQGPGIRDDGGVYEGFTVPTMYDPMISKLAVWGRTRGEAIDRLRRAVDEYRVVGIQSNLPFHRRILRDENFIKGDFDTGYLGRANIMTQPEAEGEEREMAAVIAAAILEMNSDAKAGFKTGEGKSGEPESIWKQTARREAVRLRG